MAGEVAVVPASQAGQEQVVAEEADGRPSVAVVAAAVAAVVDG